MAIFAATAFQSAGGMLINHRPDLLANGTILLAAVAAALLWVVLPRTSHA